MKTITLSVNEIRDLAMFAGLKVEPEAEPDPDDRDETICIGPCPASGILDDDEGSSLHYRLIAWFDDYPEDGAMGLGREIEAIPENGIGKCWSCGGAVAKNRCSVCGFLGTPKAIAEEIPSSNQSRNIRCTCGGPDSRHADDCAVKGAVSGRFPGSSNTETSREAGNNMENQNAAQPGPSAASSGSARMFRVMPDFSDRKPYPHPTEIPWELVENHEEWADRNHGQTLSRLNERGGLSVIELWRVVNHQPWGARVTKEQACEWLNAFVAAQNTKESHG